MNQEPDAVETAVAELRGGGLGDDDVARYERVLREFAGYGWNAAHLQAAARGLVMRREQ